MLLLYTGESRMGGAIAAQVIAGLQKKAAFLRKLSAMVDVAAGILLGNGNLQDFGHLLHESWMLKRELADCVTNSSVDDIYQNALKHGAVGGKLLGAGAKGFMLFYVPAEKQNAVRKALPNYLWVPIQLDWEGSSIIYHGSNQ
jgi:D-glycero-alpha-D-manno-heptose-7-phosphate kinase